MAIFRKKSGQTIDRGTKSYYTPDNRKTASDPLGNVVPVTGRASSDDSTIAAIQAIKQRESDKKKAAPLGPGSEGVVLSDPFVGSDVEKAYTESGFFTPTATTAATTTSAASSPVPVATSSEPVIDRSLDKPDKTIEIPQVDIRGMSTDDMYDFIDIVNFKQQKGEAITDEEQMKLMKINRALSQPQAATVENAAQAELMRLQSERELEAARVKDQAARTFETQEQVIEDEYDARRRREIEAGERQKETQLRILGDNAFSSRASVALADIDDAVSENLRILSNLENAQMQKALAEQANATSETLQSYDSLIAQMQAKTTELNLAIAEQTNEMNMQAGASYQEKIQNIMTIANQMPEAPLTPAEEALVGSYAELLIDDSGNIDSNLLKMIPSKLISSVMLKAAEVKGATRTEEPVDQSKFQWKEIDEGTFFRTNPLTGELETRTIEGLGTTDFLQQDLTGLADQFPGEAWAKNNNPSGITRQAASDGLKQAWADAGVNFDIGTPRPSSEGGNYVKFATIGDGIQAKVVALARGQQDIFNRLQQWVGNPGSDTAKKYAGDIMREAGLNPLVGLQFNELSDKEMTDLVMAQIKRESPGLHKLLAKTQDTEKEAILAQAKTKMITPSDMTDLMKIAADGGRIDEFEEAWSSGLNESARKLRKEYSSDTNIKNFENVATQYGKVVNLIEKGTGPSDLASVFNFMKTLDPTSVVRESEFEAAAERAGILDRLGPAQQWDKATQGVVLTPSQREEFASVMRELYEGQKSFYQQRRSDYIKLARESGIDPMDVVLSDMSNVVTDLSQPTDTTDNDPLGLGI